MISKHPLQELVNLPLLSSSEMAAPCTDACDARPSKSATVAVASPSAREGNAPPNVTGRNLCVVLIS